MGIHKLKKMLGKKGLYFSIDALIASLIFIAGIILLSKGYVVDQPTVTMNYFAQDIINVLGEMKVSDTQNDYVEELINNGTIKYPENTLLEQIGEFWASGNINYAIKLIENVTDGLIPANYGFGIQINDEFIYKNSDVNDENVVIARTIISGIEENKPLKGSVARVAARSVTKNMVKYIPFYPQGSAWSSWGETGYVDITKKFEISNDETIEEAILYFSAHVDEHNSSVNVIINNNPSCEYNGSDIGGEFYKSEDCGNWCGRGIYGAINISSSCFIEGYNSVNITLRNSRYNAHTHPGMILRLNYNQQAEPMYNFDNHYSERIYFDNTKSYDSQRNGAFQSLAFFIPLGAQDISTYLQINTQDVTETSGWFSNRKDYRLFLNEDDDLDYRYSPSRNAIYTYDHQDLEDNLVEGTNVLSVYLNNMGDSVWGSSSYSPTIYSDPESNPTQSSYIEINYTLQRDNMMGVIEINTVETIGGEYENPKLAIFNFPNNVRGIGEVRFHIVQLFSYLVNINAGTTNPPTNEVFVSPGSRAVPTTVFIPKENFDLSHYVNNYIRARDATSSNDFGPDSSVEYNFYINSYVGYGDLFETIEEAEEDAKERLIDLFGEHMTFEESDLIFDGANITEIPSLWGPSVIGVVLWN